MTDVLIKQKVEVLNGERGDKDEAAARIKHLRALFSQLPSEPTCRAAVGATPTKAEHDALVADVQALYAAINAVRALLR